MPNKSKDFSGLTAEEIRFCRHYFEHGNGVLAIREAFGDKYSDNYVRGSKLQLLLSNPDIQKQIETFRAEVNSKLCKEIVELIDKRR